MVVPHLKISRIYGKKNVINEQAVMSLIHKMVISIAFFFFCRYCILYHPLNMILLKEIMIRGS